MATKISTLSILGLSLFVFTGCKSDVGNVSGTYDIVPNSKQKLVVTVAQAGDRATAGEIKILINGKSDLIGSLSASENYFSQISYQAHFAKGDCPGDFKAEFDRQIQNPEMLSLKFFGNSNCPEVAYLFNQTKSMRPIEGPQH